MRVRTGGAETMAQGIIDISSELLRQLLFLPDGTKIVHTLQAEDPNTIRLVVEHPLISATSNSRGMPRLAPRWRKEQSPSTVIMVEWERAQEAQP